MSLAGKNLAALICSQVATWGATLVTIVVFPHYLGDVQMGRLSFVWSYVTFFSLIAGMGTAPFITLETARDTSRVGPYVFNTLVMKLPVVVIVSGAAIALARLLGYPQETIFLVAATCLGMALYVLNGTVIAGLQGEQRMRRTAAWYVVQRYADVGVMLAALFSGKGLVVLALASSCTEFISSGANGSQLWRRLRAAARLDLRLWKVIFLGGLPFMVWDVVGTIYATIDVSMLSFMVGDAVVGWYAVAYKLVGIPSFVPYMAMRAFFPELSAQGAQASPAFASMANRALQVVVFACAPMAVGIALVAADLVTFFHYPASFGHAIPLIRILATQIPVIGVDMVLAAAIIAAGRQKQWVVVGCLAAALNPLLNLVAIPLTSHAFGDGAIGASLITVVTEVFMFGGAICLRPAGVPDRATVAYLLRCTLASLAIIPAVLLIGHGALLLKMVVGAGVYAAASLSLRTVSLTQLQHNGIRMFQPGRLSGVAGTD